MNPPLAPSERQRIDKWLWAAHFFKTRTLAAQAIDAGRVRWQDERTKPSRELKVGDRIDVFVGDQQWTVIVRGMNEQRRPASEAGQLYAETDESVVRRTQAAEQRRLSPNPAAKIKGRPTKQAGRQIRRFIDG